MSSKADPQFSQCISVSAIGSPGVHYAKGSWHALSCWQHPLATMSSFDPQSYLGGFQPIGKKFDFDF